MKRSIILLIFLTLILPIYAFDCELLEERVEECEQLTEVDTQLIAGLIHKTSFEPNHTKIEEFNEKIRPTSAIHSKKYIKNGWIEISRFEPEIFKNNELFVPKQSIVHLDYNYQIQIPNDYYSDSKKGVCKREYSLDRLNQDVSPKEYYFTISQDGTLREELYVFVRIKENVYYWDKDCNEHGCSYDCEFEETRYHEEILEIEDNVDYILYKSNFTLDINKLATYRNTTKFDFESNQNVEISFDNSLLSQQKYEFQPFFKENNLLALKVIETDSIEINNLISTNNSFYVPKSNKCKIKKVDYFTTEYSDCPENETGISTTNFENKQSEKSHNLLFMILVFLGINYLFYILIKKTIGRVFLISFLLLIPFAYAQEDDECGIMNIGTCLPDKAYNKVMEIINAPIEPLLEQIKYFLEEAPIISILKEVWIVMIYVVSLFYGLLFIFSGFTFIFSGYDMVKRAMAKEWFYNTLVMIILVQASYYLYDLVLDLGAVLTSSVLSIVDPTFFLITIDNITNVGLEFFLYFGYVLILLLTLLLLSIRYLVIVYGLIIVPFAVFFYFVPPLRGYGKLIFNILGMFVFAGFFSSLIILTSSQLLETGMYTSMKILVMITCFFLIDILFLLIFWHAITKSVFNDVGTKIVAATNYITPQYKTVYQTSRETPTESTNKAIKENA